ncbi:MAG: DinB family protein [Ilumatobacteraceae bacterium]|jgi:uncharacterized damage-inducible protein DinB
MTARPEPPPQPDERTALESFLDYFRATLRWKADGLTDEQARAATVEPSIMSIAGLLRHMAEVERHWFQMYLRGDAENRLFWHLGPDADFEVPDDVTLAECLAVYDAEIANSQEIAARYSLDDLAALNDRDRGFDGDWQPNLRWIMVHMIEEYARHAGHADLIRERIDGVTGD